MHAQIRVRAGWGAGPSRIYAMPDGALVEAGVAQRATSACLFGE